MLRYNIENLHPDHLATIIGVLDGDGQQIAAVWIAKEQLRALLALRATKTHVTPAPSAVRDKLASFYAWCADHHDIREVKTLAETISKWQQPVIDAVLTVYSNAKAEAHNRTAKLVARNARTVLVTERACRAGSPVTECLAHAQCPGRRVRDGRAVSGILHGFKLLERGPLPPGPPELSSHRLKDGLVGPAA